MNRRPSRWQRDVLPLNYSRVCFSNPPLTRSLDTSKPFCHRPARIAIPTDRYPIAQGSRSLRLLPGSSTVIDDTRTDSVASITAMLVPVGGRRTKDGNRSPSTQPRTEHLSPRSCVSVGRDPGGSERKLNARSFGVRWRKNVCRKGREKTERIAASCCAPASTPHLPQRSCYAITLTQTAKPDSTSLRRPRTRASRPRRISSLGLRSSKLRMGVRNAAMF